MQALALLSATLIACSFSGSPNGSGGEPADAAPTDASDPDSSGPAPFLDGWNRRRVIEVGVASEEQTNFPVLVSIPNGIVVASELRFTRADGTSQLDHETIVPTALTAPQLAWVRLPKLLAERPTRLFVYYDNPAAGSASTPPSVWIDFAGVWHLEESAPDSSVDDLYVDATNQNPGDDIVDTANELGQVGFACTLDAARTDRVAITRRDPWGFDDGGLDNGLSSMTISAWVRFVDIAGTSNFKTIVMRGAQNNGSAGSWFLYDLVQNQFRFFLGNGTSRLIGLSNTIPALDGLGWKHVVAVVDRGLAEDRVSFYLNGEAVGFTASNLVANTPTSGTNDVGIGAQPNTGNAPWNGAIDEVSISSVARSAEWAKLTYENQNDPSAFAALGSEETAPELF